MAERQVGIITTGQGPRQEYLRFYGNAFHRLGLSVRILEAGALDGLSRDEIAGLTAGPEEAGIGCYVHARNDRGVPKGENWEREEVWISRDKSIPFVQRCIDRLENDGVEITILCCAEEYPAGAFRSRRPFILPYKFFFSKAKALAETLDMPRIGVLIPGQRHYRQDVATWTSRTWMRLIRLHIGVGIDPKGAAQIAREKLELVFTWGHGEGLGPDDPEDLFTQLEQQLDAPVIAPSVANVIAARPYLRPGIDPRSDL
jgi:hypothetical protein